MLKHMLRQDNTCKTSKHSLPPCSTQEGQTQKKEKSQREVQVEHVTDTAMNP
jgi:hypothetical protein